METISIVIFNIAQKVTNTTLKRKLFTLGFNVVLVKHIIRNLV